MLPSFVDVLALRTTLETDRMVVRPYQLTVAGFLQDLFLDEEGGQYLSDPPRELAGPAYLAAFDAIDGAH